MANLAIKGHSTRGSEVIALLKMLGGINSHNLCGNESFVYYTIDSDKEIKGGIYVFGDENLSIFTLEEFLEKFPYKVGDKVWLHYENLTIRVTETITCMRWCNKWNYVLYDVSTCSNLRESAFTPYKEETMDRKYNVEEYLKVWEETEKGLEVVVNDKFKLKEDNGKFYIFKKQPQYPKTYVECAKILDCFSTSYIDGYKSELLDKFQQLLICRDAYWKMAGEEMKLGKPWEPNWKDDSDKYFICYLKDKLWMSNIRDCNRLLVFPTKEMRDAFYENFKELIEACKELL